LNLSADEIKVGPLKSSVKGTIHMLKAFVLLRLPFSVLFMGGFVGALSDRGDDGQVLGLFCLLGLLVFLALTSIRLVRRRRGALWLAGLLVALEVVGAFLLVGLDPTVERSVGHVVASGCAILLLWAAPNALALYKARGLFVKPVK
jgi:hypothetical protein